MADLVVRRAQRENEFVYVTGWNVMRVPTAAARHKEKMEVYHVLPDHSRQQKRKRGILLAVLAATCVVCAGCVYYGRETALGMKFSTATTSRIATPSISLVPGERSTLLTSHMRLGALLRSKRPSICVTGKDSSVSVAHRTSARCRIHLETNEDEGVEGALIRGLVTEVLRHGRITTTTTKAKAIRRYVDKMIGLAKRGVFLPNL
eukprot:130408-Amorphochlora_amoeboformis.AAC.2